MFGRRDESIEPREDDDEEGRCRHGLPLRNRAVPPFVHRSLEKWTHREFFGTASYAAWTGIAIFLTSFGVVINNTSRGGEKKVGTAMLSVGFLFELWATIVFFYANWRLQHRPYMIALMILVILLLVVIVLAGVRIWTSIGHPAQLKPQPFYVVPAPASSSPPAGRPRRRRDGT